jgi:hypothetical protein
MEYGASERFLVGLVRVLMRMYSFGRDCRPRGGGLLAVLVFLSGLSMPAAGIDYFSGKHFYGRGDAEYLQLLDIARRTFNPDAEFQNLAMLYAPQWNGFVLGPTWNAWWIQNSYGTTYCALPFLLEPYLTFLQNSQDLWFDQMGDGSHPGCPAQPKRNWIAPDGQLCDAALPGCSIYKQGDGRTAIHDWGLEFTAAGVLLQSELLLISRDSRALAHYLPMLERSADFLESRRDLKNNLFLAGPAANLLAPSYAGWRKADGSYGKAYLAGLSVTYIAALDRLIELEKLAGAGEKVARYSTSMELARKGLPLLITDEGYFIKSLDPDGTRHGVFGAKRYGYFEASPNHDAICFRVVDDALAERIYGKIAAIPTLRPHHLILANSPSLDDMYEKPEGMWRFGRWVNGGNWSTCEARMIMAYYRLGKFADARRSFEQMLSFARRFRMDNPLTDFGAGVNQPDQPVNLTHDAFGPAAALVRGLFEYLYRADNLTLVPHVPPGITELHQLDPIRFGRKRLFLATVGSGPVRGVILNGRKWEQFDDHSIRLPYSELPEVARIVIALGGARHGSAAHPARRPSAAGVRAEPPQTLRACAQEFSAFQRRLIGVGLGDSYEAAHVQLALDAIDTIAERRRLFTQRNRTPLPPRSQAAADQLYLDTARKLCDGLHRVLNFYKESPDPQRRQMYQLSIDAK